jgi:Leucine-rich repeat (LRR) protein
MADGRNPTRLANSVVAAAFKAILPGASTRVEGITDIAELIITDREEWRSRNSLSRRLQDNSDLLAERLDKFASVELSKLEEAEKQLVIEGICSALDSVDLQTTDIIHINLDYEKLRSLLWPEVQKSWKSALLSDEGMQYGAAYFKLACRYLITLVRSLPDFNRDLMIENFALTQKISDLLQQSIESIIHPSLHGDIAQEISTFEAAYLSDILDRHNNMELFGINVPPEFRRQPIDVAYITLMSSIAENQAADLISPQSRDALLRDLSAEIAAQPRRWHSLPVDEAFRLVAAGGSAGPANNTASSRDRGGRVLLTGPAGSGKTTVSQWLAIRAAERRFPNSLAAWNACTPFIVSLRHVFREKGRRNPTERDLVSVLSYRADDLVDDWLSSKLNGDSLIIFDGLDELSQLHKSDFVSWLTRLMRDFPRANIIVTSRPDGLDYVWFEENSFSHLELQPLSLPDIHRCVTAWFKALLSVDPRHGDGHERSKRRLLGDLERPGAVRELAETPLLCAMLCAFYANDLSVTAPHSRGELYDRVISTLVDVRERARGSERADFVGLPLKSKLQLLQAVARHLTENGLLTVLCRARRAGAGAYRARTLADLTAMEIIEDRIGGMPPLPVTARQVLDHLLERSVVLREVGHGEAQFVHRSIQEYLAACDYAGSGMTDELVARSAMPEWRRTIAFAAGRLSIDAASRLVTGILDLAEDDLDNRRDLLLLAAECHSAAGSLERDIAEWTKNEIKTILPPRSTEEAELVASGGEEIIPWMGNQDEWSDEIAAACMRATAVIGGHAALNVLADYARSERAERLSQEFIHDWQYFDPTEYAERVLSELPIESCLVTIDSTPLVEAASALTAMRSVRIERPATPKFTTWRQLGGLKELDCGGHPELTSIQGISALAGLQRLNLSEARLLRDAGELSELVDLRELYLADCCDLNDLSFLSHLKNLRVLILDNCTSVSDFGPLNGLDQLRTLSVNGCDLKSLDFCGQLPGLSRLRAETRDGISDTSPLESCTHLRVLELRLAPGRRTRLRLPPGDTVRRLVLSGKINHDDLQCLGENASLVELTLGRVLDLESLDMLHSLTRLERLSVTDCRDLEDASAIGDAENLEYLDLSGSVINSTYFVRKMHKLTHARFDHCVNLDHLAGLAEIPSLEHVSLLGGVPSIDVDALRTQTMSTKRLVIAHDPFTAQYVHDPWSSAGS